MPEQRKDWVQCFYNCNYNHGSYNGQSSFIYGFAVLKLCGDTEKLTAQIINHAGINKSEVFNFNITALTPFHNEVFRTKEGE